LTISAAIAICSGCLGDSPDAYLDRTDAPLLDAADGRLRDADVECRLEQVPRSDSDVQMTLTNGGTASIDILKRGTTWDRMNRVLDVSSGGQVAKYMGIVASLRPPAEEEWVRLAPGATLSVPYEVGWLHQLDDAGQYEISLASPLLSVRQGGVPLALQHDCGTLHTYLSPSENRAVAVTTQPLIYNDSTCTADEQRQIEHVEARAQAATAAARRFSTTNNSLFATWFGTWSSANSSYVDDVLSDIEGGWSTFTGDCDVGTVPAACTPPPPAPPPPNPCASANAWVCTGADADLVHVCTTSYFSNPIFSVEAWSNQVGILVHEKSHLVSSDGDQTNAVCTDGGDNKCYGAPDARALAIAAPAQAIESGENYEHFASHAYLVSVMLPVFM
jgi:hypothetical protein